MGYSLVGLRRMVQLNSFAPLGNLRRWASHSLKGAVLMAVCFGGASSMAGDFSEDPGAKAFMDEMVKDYGFSEKELKSWLSQAKKQQSILDAISRPAEKTKTWGEYRKIFVTPSRTNKGVDFWQRNSETLAKAEETYGVPAEIIVAIIGVETRYGQHMGGYRVLDALSTLAFDYPPRSPFFTKELREFLILAREQKRDPLSLKGSYAGAMGFGQFMPSSYRAYAADFDDDGFIDIWENRDDAIGSVANYFVRHGWVKGEPVVIRARTEADYDKKILNDSLKPLHTVASLKEKGFIPLIEQPANEKASAIELEGDDGAEIWIGLTNFYAITRYNHSRLYAMAVYQLSQEILQAKEKADKH